MSDADGKEVEVQSFPPTHFNKQWTKGFTLPKPPKEGKVNITYFSKEEKLKVPVDVAVGRDLLETASSHALAAIPAVGDG